VYVLRAPRARARPQFAAHEDGRPRAPRDEARARTLAVARAAAGAKDETKIWRAPERPRERVRES
jgi:hypothetical protein